MDCRVKPGNDETRFPGAMQRASSSTAEPLLLGPRKARIGPIDELNHQMRHARA
jgi:hypothetical protein